MLIVPLAVLVLVAAGDAGGFEVAELAVALNTSIFQTVAASDGSDAGLILRISSG